MVLKILRGVTPGAIVRMGKAIEKSLTKFNAAVDASVADRAAAIRHLEGEIAQIVATQRGLATKLGGAQDQAAE